MKKQPNIRTFIPIYFLVFSICLIVTLLGSRAVTVMSEAMPLEGRSCIIIDAGHGGVDGGAISCSGIRESVLNLQIAHRVNDLFHLLGYDTLMIRTEDISVYTAGETIAQKKVSDLKERVRIINSTSNALVISIHQNYYSDERYSGGQIFYANNMPSRTLAEQLQSVLVKTLNIGSKRQAKKASGVYLLEHVSCPAVLVECGFLSNPEEEAKLREPEYQKQLSSVIATTVSKYLDP